MWTQQLTAQLGNYQPILQTITQADGECLQAIYEQLLNHATVTNNTLINYVINGICVALEQDGIIINLPSIATLKAVGVILTADNVHIGLTPLGYGFLETMNTTP